MKTLPDEFYQRADTIAVAMELLGKTLFTSIGGKVTSGIIVETEAYLGKEDKACHAYGGRRTPRTETMYLPGGHAYVYLCYGIHHLFNIVTNVENEPHAVLIRAVQPLEGIETMLKRRKMEKLQHRIAGGPGSLSLALGIETGHSGLKLNTGIIEVHDSDLRIRKKDIVSSPRVGVGYSEEFASKPWRFRIKDNPWTSPAK